jgi:hypothetical protein
MRASSLIALPCKHVESSRYSLEPIVFKPHVKLHERHVPHVRSAVNIYFSPVIKDIVENLSPKRLHPVTYITITK